MTVLALLGYEALAFTAAFGVGILAEHKSGSNTAGMYAFLGTLAVSFFTGVALF